MRSRLLSLLLKVRIGGLLLAGIALWVFAQIAEEVLEVESYAFDTNILLTIRSWRSPPLDLLMLGITFIGDPFVLLISCLILGAWLLQRKQKSEATTLAIAAIGAIGLNVLLKQLFSRARPALWDRVVDVGQYSFPSGHAMVSMVIYGFIGYILATRYRRQQVWIISLTTLLVVAIGFSRLYLGVHWPTDIIAGYAAGIVWLIACISSSKIWHRYRAK
ncbi:phosphatase PAP2 family protein [Synechocystis sp. PCC 7509]|uniref:phosphatase PAP2 family protein n=1 Tax=Synechocystis sp. PCC 7509 TaxID=927677 RepID=UPI0002AC63B4|nr:phosphatase PAP2 family protein [Synechocystis sp. PCC 7509]